MTLDSILAALNETDLADGLRPTREPSMATFPQGARPALLDPAVIGIGREWCGLGSETDAPLREAANRIAGDPGLCRLLWNINWQVFDSSHSLFNQTTAKLATWPRLTASLGNQAGLFYLLRALDFAPRLRAYHRLLKIPETVTRETRVQRALADYLSQGHIWRDGAMFFMVDDLDRLSTQHYRTQWPAIQKQFAL